MEYKAKLNRLMEIAGVLCGYIVTELLYRLRLGFLGRRCYLQIKRLVGGQHIFIGNRVSIFWGARVEAVTSYGGRAYFPRIEIGNGVAIGQNFHCTCSKHIKIGENTAITANVTITDTHHSYENIAIPIESADLISDSVYIEHSCIIFNGAVILPGTRIGCHSVVGANSVVKGKFDDYCVIAGNPARVIKRYDISKNAWIKI
jgi:acetyltransferase-like isoleucine patch superfamily enzyme